MKNNRGISLLELLIALGLLGLMVVFIGSISSELYAMKKEFLEKQQPYVQGHIASMAMFERILRSGSGNPGTSVPNYTISGNGSQIEYKRAGLTEKLYLDGTNIKYSDGSSEKVILKDVKSLQFKQDYGHRVALEIELNSGEKYRTAVLPRNEFTAQKIIN